MLVIMKLVYALQQTDLVLKTFLKTDTFDWKIVGTNENFMQDWFT